MGRTRNWRKPFIICTLPTPCGSLSCCNMCMTIALVLHTYCRVRGLPFPSSGCGRQESTMRSSKLFLMACCLFGSGAMLAASSLAQPAMPNMPNMAKMPNMAMPAGQGTVKVPDPTKVVMIVNRDSNEIAFMDIASHQMVGKTFLGNNSNPHMVMMSPDGRYVVTGGTRANAAYIIDARTLELVKKINVGIGPEHLSFSPDGRYYYQGNPSDDSVTVIDRLSLSVIKTSEGLAEPLNITFTPDGTKAYVGNYGAHWVGVIDVTRHELA